MESNFSSMYELTAEPAAIFQVYSIANSTMTLTNFSHAYVASFAILQWKQWKPKTFLYLHKVPNLLNPQISMQYSHPA